VRTHHWRREATHTKSPLLTRSSQPAPAQSALRKPTQRPHPPPPAAAGQAARELWCVKLKLRFKVQFNQSGGPLPLSAARGAKRTCPGSDGGAALLVVVAVVTRRGRPRRAQRRRDRHEGVRCPPRTSRAACQLCVVRVLQSQYAHLSRHRGQAVRAAPSAAMHLRFCERACVSSTRGACAALSTPSASR
jgi:hypothetical protein